MGDPECTEESLRSLVSSTLVSEVDVSVLKEVRVCRLVHWRRFIRRVSLRTVREVSQGGFGKDTIITACAKSSRLGALFRTTSNPETTLAGSAGGIKEVEAANTGLEGLFNQVVMPYGKESLLNHEVVYTVKKIRPQNPNPLF